MSRRICTLFPLWFGLVSVCYAGIATKHFVISAVKGNGGVGYFCVERGKLSLTSVLSRPKPKLDKNGRRTSNVEDASERWYVMGTKVKASVGGGYLAYDPTGKDTTVSLAPTADGKGTDWMILRGRPYKGKNPGTNDEEWGVLQAASGPMKGWYLDVELTEDGHRFFLSETPTCNVEVGRIFIHL